MDTQIWYAIFSTLFGGIYGIFCHIGEVGGTSIGTPFVLCYLHALNFK